MEHFKGHALFNDLEDKALQAYNRARLMVNMVLENSNGKGDFNIKAAALTTGYMSNIPKEDRKDVLTEFVSQMRKEGFALAGSPAKQASAMEAALNV